MSENEFLEDLEMYLNALFSNHRHWLPRKTGKLQNSAYKLEKTSNGYKIYIDESISPYAQYLDDKPKIKREYTNGWFNEPIQDIINKITEHYNGSINNGGE